MASTGLNNDHKTAIAAILRQLDKLLVETRNAIEDANGDPPFPSVKPDLAPRQHEIMNEGLARLRQTARNFAKENRIEQLPPPSARKSFLVALQFARVVLHDLEPDRLAGYGPLDGEATEQLRFLSAELTKILDDLGLIAADGATD